MDFFELIVVLSGTCPITGNSLEARQSYTASDLRYGCVFCALCALGWKVMLNVVISPFGIFLEIQPWLFFFFESILEMKQIGYNVSLGFKI